MRSQPKTKWLDKQCEDLLAQHWDDETSTLHFAGIVNSLGGEQAGADFFAAVLRSGLRGWHSYVVAGLRSIVIRHLDPDTRWLTALWEHATSSITTDPDQMIEVLKLLRLASSDHVRQWMAKQLFALSSNGTDAQRVFAFQGLETLIKSGGLVYLKRFAHQFDQMARSDEDSRFQLAAERIRAFLYPKAVSVTQNPIAPVSKQPDVAESRLLTAARSVLRIPNVDMVAAELEPDVVAHPEGQFPQLPVRILLGKLAELFPEDPYPRKTYPFLQEWNENMSLRVQIFGPNGDIRERKPLTFATTLHNILKAHSTAASDLDKAANELLVAEGTYDSGGTETNRIQAAKAVLQSTKYTAKLMCHSTFEKLTEREKQFVAFHRLPHTDQRNLVFVPCYTDGKRWGGMAIFSHLPISHDVTALAALTLKQVVFNLQHLQYTDTLNGEATNLRRLALTQANGGT